MTDTNFFIDEPYCTDQILEQVGLTGPIADPCCGTGQILMGLERAGYDRRHLMGWDIVDRTDQHPDTWNGDVTIQDFLTVSSASLRDRDMWIPATYIFNAPYGAGDLCEAFIKHALTLAESKVIALVSERFINSNVTRALEFWHGDYRPTEIWSLVNRPTMPPGNLWLAGKANAAGGQLSYAWAVWDQEVGWGRNFQTRFDWLVWPNGAAKTMGLRLGTRNLEYVDGRSAAA